MEPNPKLSISIVNTNNRDLLRDCLRSIYENTTRTVFEIIVIDNASNDGSVDMIHKEFPSVRVLPNASRQGYGFSHNQGIAAARGEYILIFNEDMIVLPNALDMMVEIIGKDDRIGALGCRLLNSDRTLQHSCFTFPTLKQDIFETVFPRNFVFPADNRRAKMYYWNHDENREVDIIMGCCMLMPRRVFEIVGDFDTNFFVYSEEFDLCKRVKAAGYKVYFTPDAEIIHYGGQTSKTMSDRMHLVMMDSKFKYFNKHHGRLSSIIVRSFTGVGALIRLVGWSTYWLFGRKSEEESKKMLRRYSKVLGLVAGMKKAV